MPNKQSFIIVYFPIHFLILAKKANSNKPQIRPIRSTHHIEPWHPSTGDVVRKYSNREDISMTADIRTKAHLNDFTCRNLQNVMYLIFWYN